MTPLGTCRRSDEGEEQGAGTAPERDQCGERERPGPVEEEFGERGAPADEDRRRQRTEDGCSVVRQGGPLVIYVGGFTWVQKKGLRRVEEFEKGDGLSP
ncbi:hypothetical protein ES707_22439 [subsurface metagenome]